MRLLSLMEKGQPLTPEEYFWLEKVESEDSLFREVMLPDGKIL